MTDEKLNLVHESEELFSRFAEATSHGFGMADLSGKVIFGNSSISRIAEEDPDEVSPDRSIYQYYTPEDGERLKNEILPIVFERGQWVGEIPLLSAKGNLIPAEQSIFLIPDERGEPRMIGNIVADITKRKRVKEKLRDNEQFLQNMFDAIQDGICVLDRDLRIVRANRWMKQRYIHQTPLEGKKCFMAFQQRDTPCPWCPTRKAMETGETQKTEVPYPNAEEPTGWIDLSAFPLKNEQGEVTGVIEYIKDVSARKRAEQDRKELIVKLEAQNAELERFTYTVSHDLKSPLITIMGFLGMLEKDIAAGEEQRIKDDISRISNAARKMDSLLRDLLELSRIGRKMNPPEDISLVDLAHDAIDLVAVQLVERKVRVVVPDDLPVVYGDRARLREVFQNLVENAAKYMGDQPQPRIEIEADSSDKEVLCRVRDNGMGIEECYHENIFGLFSTLDAQSDSTGVGLALVKRIIEVHGGRIWVESDGAGKGSCFCFNLPAGVSE